MTNAPLALVSAILGRVSAKGIVLGTDGDYRRPFLNQRQRAGLQLAGRGIPSAWTQATSFSFSASSPATAKLIPQAM